VTNLLQKVRERWIKTGEGYDNEEHHDVNNMQTGASRPKEQKDLKETEELKPKGVK
jgi:hypothetical protein